MARRNRGNVRMDLVMLDLNWWHCNEFMCIFFPLIHPRNSDTLAGMSTRWTRIFVSKYHSPLKGAGWSCGNS